MRRTACLCLALLLLLTAGCVRRILQVRTEPTGARTFLDAEKVGTTPVDIEFVHYGTRELVLRAPGRETTRRLVTLSPPWWQYPPFDFVTEILYPGTLVDRHEVTIPLPERRETPGETDALLKRAERARLEDLPAREETE